MPQPTISERILLNFCRPVDAGDYPGGTTTTNIGNALDFTLKTVPNFRELVAGKEVLDFGCGFGWQLLALASRGWIKRGVGVDIRHTEQAQANARANGLQDKVEFTSNLEPGRQFDLVYSCSAFEHFSDPVHILNLMLERTIPGGRVIVTFAEPWWSPRGSHMDGITRLPWVNLLFSERTVMAVRNRYRKDGAQRYEDVEGGLNRMTLRKFETIVSSCGAKLESLDVFPVKGLPLVGQLPVIRELMVAAASCTLRKP